MRTSRKGLASAVLVAIVAAGAAPAVMAAPAQVVRSVQEHSGPGSLYRTETTIPRGAAVDVLECRRLWCDVNYNRHEGWIRSSALDQRLATPVRPLPAIRTAPSSNTQFLGTSTPDYAADGSWIGDDSNPKAD